MISLEEFGEVLGKYVTPLGYSAEVEYSPGRNYRSKDEFYFENGKIGKLFLGIEDAELVVLSKLESEYFWLARRFNCESKVDFQKSFAKIINQYKILPSYYLTCKDIIE